MENFPLWFDLVVMVIYLGLFVAELYLSATWGKWYFKSGFVLYARKIKLNLQVAVSAQRLAEMLVMSPALSGFEFQALNNFQCAFREVFQFTKRYLPLMHGLIEIDLPNSEIRLTGRSDWTWLGAVALLTIFATSGRTDWVFPLQFTLVLIIPYIMQVARYALVERRLRALYA
jgi:hypothetical protein